MDSQTRCKHYHSNEDVIAIRMGCCETFYACYKCHEELSNHQAMSVKKTDFHQPHVLCGNCNYILTVNEYITSKYQCPHCRIAFNPNCSLHNHLYFEQTC
ncbi:CHY zinc finger protein [Salinibacillus xinjiangensis]|nr:CHY zinc finger protein [Salinibacillus xinjiangensis]